MSVRKSFVFVLCGILLGLGQFAANHSLRNWIAAPLQPFGRYTAPQMLERVTPIFQAMIPQRTSIRLTAEPLSAKGIDRNLGRLWNIDGIDEHEHILVHMVCGADIGEVRMVERGVTIIDPSALKVLRAHTLTRQEALHRIRKWLQILGYMETWRIEAVTQHGCSAMDIKLSANTRTANMIIDLSTGALLFAAFQPAR
jgi:hypothetical protein